MCTRYYVEMSPQLRPYVEIAAHSVLKQRMVTVLGKPFKATGEIRVTDMTTVIAPGAKGGKTAFPMVWGVSCPRT